MTPTKQAPVRYRGVKYRTRLEAKWAAFFYHLGLGDNILYDPFGTGRPTFLYTDVGHSPLYLHVTDAIDFEEYAEDAEDFLDEDYTVIVLGLSPLPQFAPEESWKSNPTPAGVLNRPRSFDPGLQRGFWTRASGAYASPRPSDAVNSTGLRGTSLTLLRTAWTKATNDIAGIPS